MHVKFAIPSGGLLHKLNMESVCLMCAVIFVAKKVNFLAYCVGCVGVSALRKQQFAVSNSVVGSSRCCYINKHTVSFFF